MQSLIVYLILTTAIFYACYRIFLLLKGNETPYCDACSSCCMTKNQGKTGFECGKTRPESCKFREQCKKSGEKILRNGNN